MRHVLLASAYVCETPLQLSIFISAISMCVCVCDCVQTGDVRIYLSIHNRTCAWLGIGSRQSDGNDVLCLCMHLLVFSLPLSNVSTLVPVASVCVCVCIDLEFEIETFIFQFTVETEIAI